MDEWNKESKINAYISSLSYTQWMGDLFFTEQLWLLITFKENKSLLYKAILSVRGLFTPTGHSYQGTDI